MLYIGFSNYSHKIHARLFCREIKHCAPIIVDGDTVIIYQFVRINKIVKIFIKRTDLKKLKKHGWQIIKYSNDDHIQLNRFCLTCVQFTKYACGIKDIRIQTPMGLLKYLNKK